MGKFLLVIINKSARLAHCKPKFFYIPAENIRKPKVFLIFSGLIEREHWSKLTIKVPTQFQLIIVWCPFANFEHIQYVNPSLLWLILTRQLLTDVYFPNYFSFIRQRASRDACCCCIKLPDSWEAMECSKKAYLKLFMKNYYSKIILSVPGRVRFVSSTT